MPEEVIRLRNDVRSVNGIGGVSLPGTFTVKRPDAQFEGDWQHPIPFKNITWDPQSGKPKRRHVDPSKAQDTFRRIVGERASGIRVRFAEE